MGLSGARDLVLNRPIGMSLLKTFTKSRRPSKQPLSLGIPTHIAIGALGIDADLDPNISSGGSLHLVELIGPI